MSEEPGQRLVPEWTLGWRMQRALAHAGITAGEIADELGVHRGTVSRWLNDRGMPPRAIYLKEWALRTGVPIGWLRHGDEPTPKLAPKRGSTIRCLLTPTSSTPSLTAA
jgi:transcriptional regulator with XRE-family HTH domain